MLTGACKIPRVAEAPMALFLISMVAPTFSDVIGRRKVGAPICGANDITEHLMALVVSAGMPLVTAAATRLTLDIMDKFVMPFWMVW